MDDDLDDDYELDESEDDPLDAENFNPVDYINKQFPNEASLKHLDAFVEKLKDQQKHIDEDIRHSIRRQAVSGRRARADLDEAKAAVRELLERIKGIKAKAEQSEALVSDVCRDIKSLDTAKRNLTMTVTALKRLVMLVTALEQLRTLASCRQYREAAGLIQAIEELAGHFQELKHVAKVADLLERKAATFSDLREQLLKDYASLHKPEHLQQCTEAAAFCVDAMGPSVRRDVITQFCLRLLEDYKDIFQPPKEPSQLETAERRFSWLKRTLHTYEDKYAPHFPESWKVPCGLCEHFCHVTRQHLVEVLSTSHHTVDPELMVRVLRKSIDFENDLARKYPVEEEEEEGAQALEPQPLPGSIGAGGAGFGLKYPDVLSKGARGGAQSEQQTFAPRFRGIISECFDAYLSSWVQHEEKQLLDSLDKSTAPGADRIVGQDERDEDDDDDDIEPRCLYASAPELFSAMKGSMTKCAGFSTHQTLFDVFQVFRKVLAQYVERLGAQMPARVLAPLDANGVRAACCVIGTAEYCDETLPQLAESLLAKIDSAFEDRVTFDVEQELMRDAMSRAISVLVLSVKCSLDEAFGKMTKTNWAQFSQEVGDHSQYVNDISDRLVAQLAPISQNLSKIHYRFFCDKFAEAFVSRFVSELYRCRKIGEQGAQQLLLDASFIKTTLLEVPVMAGKGRQMQTAYSNYVIREMGKAEAMLKVLGLPEADIEAAGALMGLDASIPEVRTELERLLALRASSDGVAPTISSPRDDERLDGAQGVQAAFAFRNTIMSMGDQFNQNSKQTSENLKKLSGDVKKKLWNVNLPGITGRKNAQP